MTWSLVNSHTLWLNSVLYAGEPYVTQIGQHVFSSLPPGLSFLSFPFVLPALLFLPSQSSVIAVYLATYSSCVFGALASVAFFKLAKMFGGVRSSVLLTLVFAFGTSMWIYSRAFLPEGLATLLGIASVYFVLRNREKERDSESDESAKRNFGGMLLSGILLGLAIFVDNMAIFLIVPILLYLAIVPRRNSFRKTGFFVFVLGLIVGAVPTWLYDWAVTGNVFSSPHGVPLIGGVNPSDYGLTTFFQGLYQEIFSPESGLLLFTPFLMISIIGLIYFLGERKMVGELLLLVGLFFSILIPFSLQSTSTYLHNTIGPSELVLVVPFALLPAIRALDRFRIFGPMDIASCLLAIGSILINGIIVLTDPVPLGLNFVSSVNSIASPLFTTDIPLFLGQSYLTWWSFFEHSWLYASAVLIFPVVIYLIYWLGTSRIKIRSQDETISPVSLTPSATSTAPT